MKKILIIFLFFVGWLKSMEDQKILSDGKSYDILVNHAVAMVTLSEKDFQMPQLFAEDDCCCKVMKSISECFPTTVFESNDELIKVGLEDLRHKDTDQVDDILQNYFEYTHNKYKKYRKKTINIDKLRSDITLKLDNDQKRFFDKNFSKQLPPAELWRAARIKILEAAKDAVIKNSAVDDYVQCCDAACVACAPGICAGFGLATLLSSGNWVLPTIFMGIGTAWCLHWSRSDSPRFSHCLNRKKDKINKKLKCTVDRLLLLQDPQKKNE